MSPPLWKYFQINKQFGSFVEEPHHKWKNELKNKKQKQPPRSVIGSPTSSPFIRFISNIFVLGSISLCFQVMFMTRSQQFAFHKPIELFKINALVVTVMKCTSQRLRIDGEFIFSKVSRAARHRFIWVKLRVRV